MNSYIYRYQTEGSRYDYLVFIYRNRYNNIALKTPHKRLTDLYMR